MKAIQNKTQISCRRKLLTASIAALSTMMVASTTTQASDIEIYQQARSGTVTLMMLFDISGSMGAPQLIGDASACDIPTGASVYSSDTRASNTTPSYTRYFCTVAETKTYKYRSWRNSGSGAHNRWQKCNNNAENRSNCSWGSTLNSKPSELTSSLLMESSGSYTYYFEGYIREYPDRITRVKDAMFDLLTGNEGNQIQAISDDKIIGLSAYSFNGTGSNGYILVPARRLDEDVKINGITKKQRAWLLEAVATKLYARGGTPTANAYAEAAAYMMGTKTFNDAELYSGATGKQVFFTYNDGGLKYTQCMSWDTNGVCNYWPSTSHTNTAARDFDFLPIDLTKYTASSCTVGVKGSSTGSTSNKTGTCYVYTGPIVRDSSLENGFNYSISSAKVSNATKYEMPSSLSQTPEEKQCSGQGIYVLTDGEPSGQSSERKAMRNALNDSNFSCTESATGTDCVLKFSNRLLTDNPSTVQIKTAVVGFGNSFNDIQSFDRNKTREQNLAALGSINTATKRAAEWGIRGGGGWYSGSSSKDVVDSVNHFINDLTTEIPSVTTGSPTIPKDALNPAVLQDDAYYQQFQPTPDKTFQLWAGNLKKYLVDENGVLKGKNGSKIVDDDGKIIDNFDYWAESITSDNADMDENTLGSTKFALRGGFWSKLALRTDPLNNPGTGTIKRKVFTDRKYSSGSDGDSIFSGISSGDLRQVKPTDLTDNVYKYDQYRGYLIRSLGYNIDAANPPTNLNALILEPEFRQTGAVMHSYPLMLTNKGKLAFNTTDKRMDSTDREDYILFGTTQGMLHVVKAGESGKAGGGEEVFTFIPNEMLEKQRKALDVPEATNGGMNNLFYGIDGPWTAYTEYVIDDSGNLTVGTGKGSQKGVQDVYGGLRMGGKSYYALNLQNINNPKLKFHIDPSGSCSNSNPLGCMGQSWSKPTIGFVTWAGKRTRVMFVGGGYDMEYENPAYNQTNKIGAGVYMFAAEDIGTTKAGDLLWWGSVNATSSANTTTSGVVGTHHAEMQYSVVSEIRSVDRNGDDLIDHIYFGDLGGQIFRVDFDNTQSTIGKVVKAPVRLFDGHASGGKSPRFYDMPAFSLYSDNGNIFGLISQGSGNRSKPLFANSSYEYDAIYNIYDKDVSRKNLFGATSWKTKDIEVPELAKLTDDDRKNDNRIKAPASSEGWYYEFTNCLTGHGDCDDYTKQTEKVFGTPVALNNKLFVSTFDASKDGLSGDCGAGVKGASLMTTFC
ncbi:pilus assembly protein PilY, partial [Acinetobacter sp. BY484]